MTKEMNDEKKEWQTMNDEDNKEWEEREIWGEGIVNRLNDKDICQWRKWMMRMNNEEEERIMQTMNAKNEIRKLPGEENE